MIIFASRLFVYVCVCIYIYICIRMVDIKQLVRYIQTVDAQIVG